MQLSPRFIEAPELSLYLIEFTSFDPLLETVLFLFTDVLVYR